MPIASTDIKYHHSTQTGDLGGAIAAGEITDASLHNLFDIVQSSEASAGRTEYRCFYVKNNHGSLTLQSAKIYVDTVTPSTDTDCQLALGSSAVNGVEQTIADEISAPTGVSFSTAVGVGNALSIGDIPAGEHKAIWVMRVVDPGASAYNTDSVIIRAAGDTAA